MTTEPTPHWGELALAAIERLDASPAWGPALEEVWGALYARRAELLEHGAAALSSGAKFYAVAAEAIMPIVMRHAVRAAGKGPAATVLRMVTP